MPAIAVGAAINAGLVSSLAAAQILYAAVAIAMPVLAFGVSRVGEASFK